MTIFTWIKYSYAFEYDVNSFSLLQARENLFKYEF